MNHFSGKNRIQGSAACICALAFLLAARGSSAGEQDRCGVTAGIRGVRYFESAVPGYGTVTPLTAAFAAGPGSGLAAGTSRIAVTAGGETTERESFNAGFPTPFTGLDDVAAYLSQAPGGKTRDDPILLPAALGTGDWPGLLQGIKEAGKYVALDLSVGAVPGLGSEFDPGRYNTGERYVVSLALPDAATSMKDGPSGTSLFRYFTALKEVSGANIETIGKRAFINR
ncbi:MAG: hypothetical protein LBI91_04575, partial [Spirochaetaceae bacterium]|nr:hypothetical protein [Spirochaetaceae bacterium]